MKRILPVLLAVVLLSVGLAGPAVLAAGSDMPNCFATAVDGGKCPTSIVDSATHHIAAFLTFSEAPTSSLFGLVLLIASLLLAAFVLWEFGRARAPAAPIRRILSRDDGRARGADAITSWLSLFELSPSF